jgi:hypothetical protein
LSFVITMTCTIAHKLVKWVFSGVADMYTQG